MNFFRAICVSLGLLLMSMHAQAAAPIYTYGWTACNGSCGTHPEYPYATQEEACQAGTAAGGNTYQGVDPATGYCLGTSNTYATKSAPKCSDGSQPDTSKPLNEQCQDPAPSCPAVGTVTGHGVEVAVSSKSLNLCSPSGCAWTASGLITAGSKIYAIGPFMSAGTCSGSVPGTMDTPTDAPPIPDERCTYKNPTTGQCEAACPTGQVYKQVPTGAMACVKTDTSAPEPPKDTSCPPGYINTSADPANVSCAPSEGRGETSTSGPANCPAGQHSVTSGGTSYCVFDPPPDPNAQPKTTEKTTAPKTTTQNPDGSTTETQVETRKNTDGSTTTTTTTTKTNPDGTKTTSTNSQTGLRPDGSQGVSDQQDGELTDLCKRNPQLNICNNSKVESAHCSNGVPVTNCTGDAIQCAILRQAVVRYCAEQVIENAAYTKLGGNVLSGVDPMKAGLPSPDKSTVFNMATSLDKSGWMGEGACFPNKTIEVAGQSLVIPFEEVCPYLLPFRAFLMLVAAMASLRIVGAAVFR